MGYEQAVAIGGTGDADMPAPSSTIRAGHGVAAAHFGAQVKAPSHYQRSQPSRYRDLLLKS